MRKIFLAFVFLFAASAFAQIRVTDATIASGRGALSSGIYAEINLGKLGETDEMWGKSSTSFQFTQDYFQVIYTKKFGSLTIGPSAGFFLNAPWVGPFIKFKPVEFVSLISWTGVSAGQADDPDWSIKYSFAYHCLRVDIGPAYVCGTMLSFQKDRLNTLLGTGLKLSLEKNIDVTVSYDYSLRDEQPLFSTSLCYTF